MSFVGKFALQACNGKYVCALGGGGQQLTASSDTIGRWETFTMIRHGSDSVSIMAQNGQFICAENSGSQPLVANRDNPALWERFRLFELPDGNVALQAVVNNRLVCAENAGSGSLIANRINQLEWETFRMHRIEDFTVVNKNWPKVTIRPKARVHGNTGAMMFLTAYEGKGPFLTPWFDSVGDRQVWYFIPISPAWTASLLPWEIGRATGILIHPELGLALSGPTDNGATILVQRQNIDPSAVWNLAASGDQNAYYAIRPVRNFGLNLNVSGNEPYYDPEALVWNWEHGADNELWEVIAYNR